MTRGLQLSSANNILDLTSKRTALMEEKSNLEKSGHLTNPALCFLCFLCFLWIAANTIYRRSGHRYSNDTATIGHC